MLQHYDVAECSAIAMNEAFTQSISKNQIFIYSTPIFMIPWSFRNKLTNPEVESAQNADGTKPLFDKFLSFHNRQKILRLFERSSKAL